MQHSNLIWIPSIQLAKVGCLLMKWVAHQWRADGVGCLLMKWAAHQWRADGVGCLLMKWTAH
eukprot:1145375-Pelagomonas_calceolata.AAC.3